MLINVTRSGASDEVEQFLEAQTASWGYLPNYAAAMVAIATGDGGEALDDTDRAVLAFAGQVARDATWITESDVDALRRAGLTDDDIADVVFAAAARAFFTKVIDSFGVQADHQLGAQFAPEVCDGLVVGRPIADAP